MANPFFRRATEFIRDDESFLAIVSPAPLTRFLTKHVRLDDLFSLPVRIIGEPGSGKTMLATLAEFRLVEEIARDQSNQINKDLASALAQAGFLNDGKPSVAAVRVPMESEYRDFWELPYDTKIKTKLALSLVQARAMLGLIRNMTVRGRRGLDGVRFVPKEGTEAQVEQIGGKTTEGIRQRALEVQKAIYSIAAGLLPPKLSELPTAATNPYQPFETIQAIEIEWEDEKLNLQPLVILDDVHSLHPQQYEEVFVALSRREIKFGRWMMMRLDALTPRAVFRSVTQVESHNLKRDRDFVDIYMQGGGNRGHARNKFRQMAGDIADRYLPLVPALRDRNAIQFQRLVSSEPPPLTASKTRDLSSSVDTKQKKLDVTLARRRKIDAIVSQYLESSKGSDKRPEVAFGMTSILMHRYANRIAGQTPSLFDDSGPDPKKPLKADSDVAEAARIYLHHEYDRPFHYGMNDLCDASNENAELFLQLAGALVARMETRAIRNQPPTLPPNIQQSALQEKASQILDSWSFPFAGRVKQMIDEMAKECLAISLLPNARLGSGANAIGIPEAEFEKLLRGDGDLKAVLKYAAAYGAINAIRDYGQGGQEWCLIELSGPVCLAYGLTLKRGGFLEKHVEYLEEIASSPSS